MEQPWQIPMSLTPKQQEKKAVRRSANFCGFLMIAMMAVQELLSVLLVALALLGVLDASSADYGLGNTGYQLLNMLLYLLFLPVPAIAVALIAKSRVSPFPTRRVPLVTLLCLTFAGMAMAVLANIATSYLMSVVENMGVPPPQFPDTIQPTTTSLWLNILSTAVLPALVEEMIFRGYFLGALRPHGDGIAVVLSAFVFGLFHGNILQFPFAFLLGLVFGFVVVQTGSIWPAVLIHFGNNLMSVLLEYFVDCYPELPDGVLTMGVFTAVCVVGVAAMAVLLLQGRANPRRDVFAPIGNGLSPLPVGQRVRTMLLSPALLAALMGMTVTLLIGMVR